MAKITSASSDREQLIKKLKQRIKELEKYETLWNQHLDSREVENKRIFRITEIKRIIEPLEDRIAKVRRATVPNRMQKNFDILLNYLMKTAYALSKSPRPGLKTQIKQP